MPGENIFTNKPLVLEVLPKGFWLSVANEKLFLDYADFPWFAGVSMEQLAEVQRLSPDHLFWPALDVDLSLASIRNPAAFPLLAMVGRPE